MNCLQVLSLFLIALSAVPAFGQSNPIGNALNQLIVLYDRMEYVLKNVVAHPDTWPLSYLDKDIAKAQELVDSLPLNAGTFLNNAENGQLLNNTAKFNVDFVKQLTAVINEKFANSETGPSSVPKFSGLLSSLNNMLYVTGRFDSVLNYWSYVRLQELLDRRVFVAREQLLKTFEFITPDVCVWLKSNTLNAEEHTIVLYVQSALQALGKRVHIISCGTSFYCTIYLTPIADRIYQKAKCP